MQSSLPNIGDTVGNYRVLRRIGAGGMGVVLEAINLDTDGKVALKFLSPELLGNPEAVKRFRVEAKATGRIQHPNVVAVHNMGEHQGQLFLVMEFLRGKSLRDHLTKGLFTVERALQIMFPVMRGVAAAHALGVLHRDLKPENIFLAESPDGLEPVPKVLDFGIAKLTSEIEGTNGGSARTAFMGTYQYMAFEQLHARKDLDARVDVYALGTVLFHILTGALPYRADNPVDLALAMLQSEPTPVTQYDGSLPEELADVISISLARDREQRYPDIETFASALEPWAGGLRYRQTASGMSTGPVPAGARAHLPTPNGRGWQPPGRADSGRVPSVVSSPTPFVVRKDFGRRSVPPKRNTLGWVLGAGLLLGGLGLGAVLMLRKEPPQPPPGLPTAGQEPVPVQVKDSAVSAQGPRTHVDAGVAVENDDWGAAPPPTRLVPADARQEPMAAQPMEALPIDPRAGQPEQRSPRSVEERSSTHQTRRTHREPAREEADGERPRTRSGLGVSSEEF